MWCKALLCAVIPFFCLDFEQNRNGVLSITCVYCLARRSSNVLITCVCRLVYRESSASRFAFTRQALSLLEKVGVCVTQREPILLVGETGTGKTSLVQYLSEQTGSRLYVINMNQQSDPADLLGGYKPVVISHIVAPIRDEFLELFKKTFSQKQNETFVGKPLSWIAKKFFCPNGRLSNSWVVSICLLQDNLMAGPYLYLYLYLDFPHLPVLLLHLITINQ